MKSFKKFSDIFNNHQKIASHTNNLRRVKLSKLNNFGLMTKLLIDSHILYDLYYDQMIIIRKNLCRDPRNQGLYPDIQP